jgi:hypothetical protein
MKGILLDVNGDIMINNGSIVIDSATQQNQRNLLLSEKGDIKETPLLGAGLTSFLDDDNPSDCLREIRSALRMDGQNVKSCCFDSNGKLIIIAGYENN